MFKQRNDTYIKKIFILILAFINPDTIFYGYAQKTGISTNPFFHGVASGDPLPDRVIIWTRVTINAVDPVAVQWLVAKDEQMTVIVQSGVCTTDASKDYTVKIDATGLMPATVYYYQFMAGNKKSAIGKTKTAPVGNPTKLTFAVVSCSNYAEGYFNALGKIAARNNVDAVIHLGDYIYEGTQRSFESRAVLAEEESIDAASQEEWLVYYRKRYATSRRDSNLQQAHQIHPFINIWDDHEIVDNAHKEGSYMHDPKSQGLWEDRKAAARQAYAEWIPIRGDASKIYRSLKFGNLMELILLDTRLEGRDQQLTDASDSRLYETDRTLLGDEQRQWLLQRLKTSSSMWKVVGNQVIFSDFNLGWIANTGIFTDKVQKLESNLLDYWQGYPVEREKVINCIKDNKIDNVVILSASMHCAMAFDVIESGKTSDGANAYNPATGKGSVAVEFAAPSISSANFDEKIGPYLTSAFESSINTTLLPFNANPNPHMKFVDLDQHGYFILELTPKRAQASWYFVDTILKPASQEQMAESWYTQSGQNYLQRDIAKKQ